MSRYVCALAALILLANSHALAQEDTTPPTLLDFTIAPVVFDTGPGVVTLEGCITASDDLAGLIAAKIRLWPVVGEGPTPIASAPLIQGSLHDTACFTTTVPQFSQYGFYGITVSLGDLAENKRTYTSFGSGDLDLCSISLCQVENRPDNNLPDSDGDGVPDDADNCPDDPNADQADADRDLIGDACDPFPDERDHEKAQCFEDLIACESIPAFVDSDGDGEEDSTDACPGTSFAAVDAAGCSLWQFCASIDTSVKSGARICRQSDWLNDEPITSPGDCVFSRGGGVCVPAQ